MAEGTVILKFVGPKPETTVVMFIHNPWHFDPYCEIPFEEYALSQGYFNEYKDMFVLVPRSEYEAYLAEKAARAAEVHYCGDSGGQNKKGEFCGRRVEGPGCRCEHHGGNEEALQGTYGPLAERPEEYQE